MRLLERPVIQWLIAIGIIVAILVGLAWCSPQLKRAEHRTTSILNLFILAQEIDRTITDVVGEAAPETLVLNGEEGLHKVMLVDGVYRSLSQENSQSRTPHAAKEKP